HHNDSPHPHAALPVDHREEERIAPPTVYGRQKIRAEELALKAQPDTVALRLSWMFAVDFREGQEHGNLISTVCKARESGDRIRRSESTRRNSSHVSSS